MTSESWDVFTKRVFVEKQISGIMYENPGVEGHWENLLADIFTDILTTNFG